MTRIVYVWHTAGTTFELHTPTQPTDAFLQKVGDALCGTDNWTAQIIPDKPVLAAGTAAEQLEAQARGALLAQARRDRLLDHGLTIQQPRGTHSRAHIDEMQRTTVAAEKSGFIMPKAAAAPIPADHIAVAASLFELIEDKRSRALAVINDLLRGAHLLPFGEKEAFEGARELVALYVNPIGAGLPTGDQVHATDGRTVPAGPRSTVGIAPLSEMALSTGKQLISAMEKATAGKAILLDGIAELQSSKAGAAAVEEETAAEKNDDIGADILADGAVIRALSTGEARFSTDVVECVRTEELGRLIRAAAVGLDFQVKPITTSITTALLAFDPPPRAIKRAGGDPLAYLASFEAAGAFAEKRAILTGLMERLSTYMPDGAAKKSVLAAIDAVKGWQKISAANWLALVKATAQSDEAAHEAKFVRSPALKADTPGRNQRSAQTDTAQPAGTGQTDAAASTSTGPVQTAALPPGIEGPSPKLAEDAIPGRAELLIYLQTVLEGPPLSDTSFAFITDFIVHLQALDPQAPTYGTALSIILAGLEAQKQVFDFSWLQRVRAQIVGWMMRAAPNTVSTAAVDAVTGEATEIALEESATGSTRYRQARIQLISNLHLLKAATSQDRRSAAQVFIGRLLGCLKMIDPTEEAYFSVMSSTGGYGSSSSGLLAYFEGHQAHRMFPFHRQDIVDNLARLDGLLVGTERDWLLRALKDVPTWEPLSFAQWAPAAWQVMSEAKAKPAQSAEGSPGSLDAASPGLSDKASPRALSLTRG